MKLSCRKFCLLGALLSGVILLTGCTNDDTNIDYVDSDTSVTPELVISGLAASASTSYDYLIDETGKYPGEAAGTFTVYVKNAQPARIEVQSSDSLISVTRTSVEATTDEDSVGAGAWKALVSYSVSESLQKYTPDYLDSTLTVTALFSVEDTIQKKVQVKASYLSQNAAYKLTNLTVSGPNEHVFTLGWTNPAGVTWKSVSYKVYQIVGENKVLVESGALENPATATSFTTTAVLAAKSNFYVEITAVSAKGWYVTTSDGVPIATTDDITPPDAPNLTVNTDAASYNSATLTYAKYTTDTVTDDTATLSFAVTDASGTAVTGLTITATGVDASGEGVTETSVYENERYRVNVLNLATAESAATVTISGFPYAQTAKTYTISATGLDNLENESAATPLSATTVADTVAPAAVTALAASAGRASVTLTWAASASEDVSSYKVYQNGVTEAVATVSAETLTASITGLTNGTAYTFTVKAADYAGNESDGVHVSATPAIPAASNVAATVKYTGSILVTWDDTTAVETDASGNALTYSYVVSCTDLAVAPQTISAGVKKAHFTGLTTGSEYGFTVKVVDSSNVDCATSDEVTATAKVVVWQIANAYQNSSSKSWVMVPVSSAFTAPSDDVVTRSDLSSYTYTKWIVRSAEAENSDVFYLEAAKSDGTGSNKFMYFDSTGRYTSSNGYDVPGWYYSGEAAHAFVAAKPATDDDAYKFKFATSGKSDTAYVNGVESSAWTMIVSAASDVTSNVDALYDFGNRDSANSLAVGQTGVEANWTYLASYTDIDYSVAAPAAVTALTASEKTDTTVTLTWTNPSDADFSHVVITEQSNDAISVTATGTTATVTGLTQNTGYIFVATAYDVYGNASSTTTVSVTTNELIQYPTNVAASVKYTGSVLVTWTDIAATGYTYKVECTSDANVVAKTDIAEGTQKAYFAGLTVGTEYTFKVSGVKESVTYTDDTSVDSVTPTQVVVYLQSGTGNTQCGGGTKYLCNSLGVSGSEAGIGCYIPGTSDNAYSAAVEKKWIVYPGLSDPTNENAVSFASNVTTGKYLQIFTSLVADNTIAAGNLETEGKVGVKGEMFDWGYAKGDDAYKAAAVQNPLLLVDTPTSDADKALATFIRSDSESSGWEILTLASDSTLFLAGRTFRANADTQTTEDNSTNSASWDSVWYSRLWKFVSAN